MSKKEPVKPSTIVKTGKISGGAVISKAPTPPPKPTPPAKKSE